VLIELEAGYLSRDEHCVDDLAGRIICAECNAEPNFPDLPVIVIASVQPAIRFNVSEYRCHRCGANCTNSEGVVQSNCHN
jgi:hypothetical protein